MQRPFPKARAGAMSVVLLALGLLGCGNILGIDDLVADLDDAGVPPGGGCTSVCGTPGCGPCPTTGQVEVDSANGPYCIDAHEVTNAEYQAYLDTSPSAPQREDCSYNDSLQPGVVSAAVVAGGSVAADVCPGGAGWLATEITNGGASRPAACVDWCDAIAYCAWAGKHLCGKVGGGGKLVINEVPGDGGPYDDPAQSEWYRACSNAGAQKFPYGNETEPTFARCNDENGGPEPVGSYPDCVGGYTGLFDMSGNVGEWEDACTSYNGPPIAQNCLVRGGAHYEGGDDLSCLALRGIPVGSMGDSTGFRCCSGC
jgi:formylglycine-generating enzyme